MTFDDVKSRLTMAEVARHYWREPNRAGFVKCPFHNERTASLKLYDKNFHCFGCGAHGDVIDFVGKLFSLSALDAVKKLDSDFHLGLQLDRPPDPEAQRQRQREREAKQLFDEWRGQMLNRLDACIRIANNANYDSISNAEATALQYRESLIYWADLLAHGDLDEQQQIFRDRRIEALCQTILQMKPSVAWRYTAVTV